MKLQHKREDSWVWPHQFVTTHWDHFSQIQVGLLVETENSSMFYGNRKISALCEKYLLRECSTLSISTQLWQTMNFVFWGSVGLVWGTSFLVTPCVGSRRNSDSQKGDADSSKVFKVSSRLSKCCCLKFRFDRSFYWHVLHPQRFSEQCHWEGVKQCP